MGVQWFVYRSFFYLHELNQRGVILVNFGTLCSKNDLGC